VRQRQKTDGRRANGRAAQQNARPVQRRSAPASRVERIEHGRDKPLTERDIVDHTLRLIRDDGFESLSMRKLAAALGVAPMSLYHHVKNKDELLGRVVDTLLARIPTPPARRAGWRNQLSAYGMAFIEQLTFHPGIARVVTERPPTSEGQRHLRYVGDVLLAAGADSLTAAQCLATFHTFIYGVLSAQAHLPALMATVAKKYDLPRTQSRKASAGSMSAISVNEHLRNLGLHAWYQVGIDSILSAIALQLRASSRARPISHARGDA
jgi:AcrR family transcriptional regulator